MFEHTWPRSVWQPRVEQSDSGPILFSQAPGHLGVIEAVPGPDPGGVMEDPGLQQLVTARGEAVNGLTIMAVHKGSPAPIEVTSPLGVGSRHHAEAGDTLTLTQN